MTHALVRLLAILFALSQPLSGTSAISQEGNGCPDALAETATALTVAEVISQRTFDELVGWIALNTSYDLSRTYNDPPTLSFCAIGDIVAYEEHDLLIERGLLAALDYPRRHVFLVEPWSGDSLFDLSLVLHELIHDAQLSNRTWACLREPELEAYMLQDKWLREHGIEYPFDWSAIMEMSRCRP